MKQNTRRRMIVEDTKFVSTLLHVLSSSSYNRRYFFHFIFSPAKGTKNYSPPVSSRSVTSPLNYFPRFDGRPLRYRARIFRLLKLEKKKNKKKTSISLFVQCINVAFRYREEKKNTHIFAVRIKLVLFLAFSPREKYTL